MSCQTRVLGIGTYGHTHLRTFPQHVKIQHKSRYLQQVYFYLTILCRLKPPIIPWPRRRHATRSQTGARPDPPPPSSTRLPTADNVDLGTACGKFYRVSSLSITDPGDSDIIRSGPEAQ